MEHLGNPFSDPAQHGESGSVGRVGRWVTSGATLAGRSQVKVVAVEERPDNWGVRKLEELGREQAPNATYRLAVKTAKR
jgi:hypothetical protein